MSRNYNDLLRLTYEIEGLLLLQSQRADGDTVSAVDNMIAEKTALLAKAFPSVPTHLPRKKSRPDAPQQNQPTARLPQHRLWLKKR